MVTIINLIANLQSNLNKPFVKTTLTPAEIEYINTLIKAESNISGNSDIIIQIQTNFNSIIKEGGIGLQDIPLIVLIVSNILKTHMIQNTIQNVGIINIIKFILDSLFDSDVLPINHIEAGIIKNLVDSSLQLLKTNIDFVVQEEQVICGFFQACNCTNLENECYKFLEYYSL
jgi:hypothetical protein